jgi:AraC-like DNA-binding protein
LQQLVGLIEAGLVQSEPDSRDIVRYLGAALCEWVVRHLSRRADRIAMDHSVYWAERVRLAIENHFQSDLSLAQILGGLGLCYRQLARHFERQFGISPKRYQLIRRMEEARRLIGTTNLPVTTVALELGFGSSQHFATRFRQITGQSPTALREKSGEEKGSCPAPRSDRISKRRMPCR